MISSISNYIPTPCQIICNVGNNLKKISAIALPLIAISSVQTVQAGPIAAAACFVACEAFLATLAPPAAVAYAPTCFAGCKIALAAPTP
jgi:hypothetical protein